MGRGALPLPVPLVVTPGADVAESAGVPAADAIIKVSAGVGEAATDDPPPPPLASSAQSSDSFATVCEASRPGSCAPCRPAPRPQRTRWRTISPCLPHRAHPASRPPSAPPPQQRPSYHPPPWSQPPPRRRFSSHRSPTRSSSVFCGVSTLNLIHCCLSRCIPARYGASPSPAFTLRLSNDTSADDGDVVIAQHKHVAKRSVSDLASWMEAWNLYVQVLVAAYPQRAPTLLAYQAIICGVSSRFAPRLCLRCDQRFHASAAADSTLRWNARNNELWLECFTQASLAPTAPANKPARHPCTYCGSLYHYPDNCPSHPFRARKRLTPPASKPVQSAPTPAPPSSTPTASPQPQHTNQPLPHPCNSVRERGSDWANRWWRMGRAGPGLLAAAMVQPIYKSGLATAAGEAVR